MVMVVVLGKTGSGESVGFDCARVTVVALRMAAPVGRPPDDVFQRGADSLGAIGTEPLHVVLDAGGEGVILLGVILENPMKLGASVGANSGGLGNARMLFAGEENFQAVVDGIGE
jgi:hypothetical protein